MELELILQTNENLPTDELEIIVRDLIVMDIRERDFVNVAQSIPAPPVPNSHELSEMAKTEWLNREERRGIHNREDWCSGWISGFLTPNKPDWTKEREISSRNATLDEVNEAMLTSDEIRGDCMRDAIRVINSLRTQTQEGNCIWSEDDDGNWHTSCNQIHQFANGTPEDNHHKFCPYCGKPISTQEGK
jgi:hypothetical protein